MELRSVTFTVTQQGDYYRVAVMSRLTSTDSGEYHAYQHLTVSELASVVEAHLGRVFWEQLSLF